VAISQLAHCRLAMFSVRGRRERSSSVTSDSAAQGLELFSGARRAVFFVRCLQAKSLTRIFAAAACGCDLIRPCRRPISAAPLISYGRFERDIGLGPCWQSANGLTGSLLIVLAGRAGCGQQSRLACACTGGKRRGIATSVLAEAQFRRDQASLGWGLTMSATTAWIAFWSAGFLEREGFRRTVDNRVQGAELKLACARGGILRNSAATSRTFSAALRLASANDRRPRRAGGALSSSPPVYTGNQVPDWHGHIELWSHRRGRVRNSVLGLNVRLTRPGKRDAVIESAH